MDLDSRRDVGNRPDLDDVDPFDVHDERTRTLQAERKKEQKEEERKRQEAAKTLSSIPEIHRKIVKQKRVSASLKRMRGKTKKKRRRKTGKSHKKKRISRRGKK